MCDTSQCGPEMVSQKLDWAILNRGIRQEFEDHFNYYFCQRYEGDRGTLL